MKRDAARGKRHRERKAASRRTRLRNSMEEPPFWSPGGSGSNLPTPSLSAPSLFGTSPMVPALLLLVVFMVLLSSAVSHHWLSSGISLPSATSFSELIWKKQPSIPTASVDVWTKRQSGFYYCKGDILFGREPGKFMTQADALMMGYQPAGGQYCGANEPNKAPSSQSFFGIK